MSDPYRAKYIRFSPVHVREGQKTAAWLIHAIDGGQALGGVRWFGRWRKYCFFPNLNVETVFEERCLRDIAEFVERETRLHRQRVQAVKQAAKGVAVDG